MIKLILNHNSIISKSQIKKINKVCKIISKIEKIKNKTIIELSIIEDMEMKEICKKYYKKKSTTDVLSFGLEKNLNFKFNLIGEIFINNDKVISQSKEFNHSYERELIFLSIHGILHLLGYDHNEELSETIMIEKQKEILNKMKVEK